MNLKTIVKWTISLAVAVEGIALVAPLTWNITPSAEAKCVDSGRRVGGVRVLNCTGGKSCCRKTGRTKIVRGRRYQVLDCSRCR